MCVNEDDSLIIKQFKKLFYRI